jgi:hypothetical protein
MHMVRRFKGGTTSTHQYLENMGNEVVVDELETLSLHSYSGSESQESLRTEIRTQELPSNSLKTSNEVPI